MQDFKLPPALLDWFHSDDGALLRSDVEIWSAKLKRFDPEWDIVMRLEWLFWAWDTFRSLFDYRASTSRDGAQFRKIFREKSRTNDLYIHAGSIGPGCIIHHGHGTRIGADSIGSNFWINHNVTVGWNGGRRPTIGNNVRIMTGAVVVGPITIGDNVIITANAVVSCDVPSDSIVYAARSVIVPKR